MARKKRINLHDIQSYRTARGENQCQFWQRFGVTQSGGSRYENGRTIPPPVALLLVLFLTEQVDDNVLSLAKKSH